MPGLPETGELTYNGYTFDGASNITVDIEFVYDDVGRAVIGSRHQLTVRAVIADENSLDGSMQNIRRRLAEPGAALRFINKGFGDDLIIPLGDIDGGPYPKELAWEPLGDDKAAEIIWRLDVMTADCGLLANTRTGRSSGVMGLNWTVEWSIDAHGDTQRVIQGYLHVVQRTGPAATDSADRYREKIAAVGIPGFAREQSWGVTPDRKRLTFTIIDTQIPSPQPYPGGVTDIQGVHQFEYRRSKGNLESRNVISMRITPAAGLSGAQAYNAFLAMVRRRLRIAHNAERIPWLDSLRIEEGLFTRSQSFEVQYRFLKPVSDILTGTGLWQPLGTNWRSWVTSLAGASFNHRGTARMGDIASEDVVINLCSAVDGIYPNGRASVPTTPAPRLGAGLKNEEPPKDKSYIKYRSIVMPSAEDDTVRQAVIQPPGPEQTDWELYGKPLRDFLSMGGATGTVDDIIQRGGARRHSVTFIGEAERAGHPIPRPSVTQVGTRAAHPVWQRFVQEAKDVLGIPVYTAKWAIHYVLGGAPGRVTIPPNHADED